MMPKTKVPATLAPSAEPAPVADDVLSRLTERSLAPQRVVLDAGEAVRAGEAVTRQRAAACAGRLRAHEPAVLARLARVRALEVANTLVQWQLQLGSASTRVRQIRDVVRRLEPVFLPTLHDDLTVPSTLEVLAGIPSRIVRLEARDAHACPRKPPGCGCVVATIRQHVEDAEATAVRVPSDMAALDDALERLEQALLRRVDPAGAVHVHRAPSPSAAAVTVTTSTGEEFDAPEGA